MKNKWILSLSILAVISMACTVSGKSVDFGRIEGSGVLVHENRPVEEFSEVSLSGIGNLYIEQGDEDSVIIEAEENILPELTTTVQGKKLLIGVRTGINVIPTQKINYYVTMKNIDSIRVLGAGNIYINDEIQADALHVDLTGFGSIKIDELKTKSLEILISGAGNIDIAGVADRQRIRISGAGKYEAGDLLSQDTDVIVSGLGGATVWVEDNLSVVISGGGNIDYYGNPQTKRTITGLGNMNSRGDHEE
jgi:hypothetical protein